MGWELSGAWPMMRGNVSLDPLEIVRRLRRVKIFDYFKSRSMPDFVEPLISELVASFSSYSEIQQQEVLSTISPEVSSLFGWYARKLAGRAVRDCSREDLRNGLFALLISAHSGDFRDAMAPLALLYNSALRLQEDPKVLFEKASRASSQPVKNLLEEFLRRPIDLKSIQTFGFSEGVGPHGFDYAPFLPEYGGPTPF